MTETRFEQRGEAKAQCGSSGCTEYSEFTYDEFLRIRDFKVNGVPVDALVNAPFDEATNDDVGISTRLEGGYSSTTAERMRLNIEIRSFHSAKVPIDYESIVSWGFQER